MNNMNNMNNTPNIISNMKILFIGSKDIGHSCLQQLINWNKNIVGVIARPDDPHKGQWYKSVTTLAQQHNIPCFQPKDINDPQFREQIQQLQADLAFTAQFPQIYKQDFIDLFPKGCINLHFAPLPKYRGCFPIPWAIINGEKEFGVTIHHIRAGVDNGAIIAQSFFPIQQQDTGKKVYETCTQRGLELFQQIFPQFEVEVPRGIPQDETKVIQYKREIPFEGKIIWDKPSQEVYNFIRALYFLPFDAVFTSYDGKKIPITAAEQTTSPVQGAQGLVVQIIKGKGCFINTKDNQLLIKKIQTGPYEEMDADAYFLQEQIHEGSILGGPVFSNIPLVDLKLQYRNLKPEIDQAIKNIIDNASFILGKPVEDFEQKLAEFCSSPPTVPYAVGVSSGTSALFLALKAHGIKSGDEVITTAHSFIATAEAILHCGAKPVFVDIDPETMLMDINQIEKNITPKTKAIVPVHLYGQICDMDPLIEIANKHNLVIVEDAAQAIDATYKGRKLPISETGIFSFFPAKNLGCFGDGGAVITKNPMIAETIKKLRDHGRINKYESDIIGYGERLDALQAAILNVKLKHLPLWTQQRRTHAEMYKQQLGSDVLGLPFEKHQKHVYYMFVIRTKHRDKLKEALAEKGISTGIHFPIPLHLQPCLKHLGYQKGDFPITEKAAQEILSLPMYPELTPEQITHITKQIQKIMQQLQKDIKDTKDLNQVVSHV